MSRTVFALLLLLGALPVSAEAPPAVLDVLLPEGRLTQSIAAQVEKNPLPSEQEFRIIEVGRDANTSHHLVWIRDREIPHRHDHHDLFVVIVQGYGGMRLGEAERTVGEGSILYVPRGTVHAFRNAADGPAVAYAVYAPAFDGRDRIEVSD